ncbi:MAG: hypothetical protein CM15mV51_1190 [uncultured marine virus]|nr:MAG: hypothetical protein CM15mV51_1190 [uncultured marine virus]
MMTDNAKKKLADKLGLNVRNIGLVGNMVALGVPLTEAVFINKSSKNKRPTIRTYISW